MLSLFSWGSNLGCDSLQTPDTRMFGCKQSTSLNTSYMAKDLKRKRPGNTIPLGVEVGSTGRDIPETQDNTAVGQAQASSPPTQAYSMPPTPETCSGESEDHPSKAADEQAKSRPTSEARLHKMKQTIQTQLSLEILLKHKELRLIDQELAKCQIALEQLRRCTEIPYPSTQLSERVSSGTGPALRKPSVKSLPHSPAPWGVTEGPYSRHYAKWLIPDTHFDGGDNDYSLRSTAGKAPSEARSSRVSISEPLCTAIPSRSQRSGKLKALPAGYGQPKEKASGPLILKRKSDGAMVKLVCPDCGRLDFGSAQGFINHCRIGHNRPFASHDEAAERCGERIGYDEAGVIVSNDPPATPAASNVHQLIRNAHKFQHNHVNLLPASTSTMQITSTLAVSPDFKGSTITPNLSALVQSRGLGLNLQDLVTKARTRVELPESDNEDDAMDLDTPLDENLQGRHPQVAGSKHPVSSVSMPDSSPMLSTRLPKTNLNLPTPETSNGILRGGDDSEHGGFLSSGPATPLLEVSPTVESNQAPSLVDDEEEFEPHSPSSSTMSDHGEEEDVEFAVHDDEHEAAHDANHTSETVGCNSTPTPLTPGHRRRPSAIRRSGAQREARHVTFVSPSPAQDMTEPTNKRRKLNSP